MTLRLRRDTAANWTAANPVLSSGQPGFETNTGRLKIGDGVTAWNSLGYLFETSTVADGDKGDITVSGSGATWTIDAGAVTYAKMQDVSAGSVLLGRGAGAAGDPQEITLGTNLSMTGTTLNATGGGGVTDGDKGDITVSGSGAVWTIDAGVVTLAKQADVATSTLFYRKTAGTGAPEVQTLATLKTDLGLTGTNSGDQTITLTGDVTGSGTGSFAATVANDAVTNAKLANVATATIKGRTTAGTGDPEDLTGTQATALLDAFTSGAKGLAPASGGGTTNFLRADGTWAAPGGGGAYDYGMTLALGQGAFIC